MLARILAFLSLLGLLVVCLFIAGDLNTAHRIEHRPRWPSKQSASFAIHEGDAGSWDVRWEDVPGADGSGILWFRTNPFRAFLLRGVRKVRGEWNLVCTALNLRRMSAMVATG